MPRLRLQPPRQLGAVPRVRGGAAVTGLTGLGSAGMWRLRRRSLGVAAGLSAAIFAVSLLSCLGSFGPMSPLHLNETSQGRTCVALVWGDIVIDRSDGFPHRRFNERNDLKDLDRGLRPQQWGSQDVAVFPGIRAYGGVSRYAWSHGDATIRYSNVRVTLLWLIGPSALLTLGLGTTWVVRVLRRRRAVEAGLCVACGYDLRATAAACPECAADTPLSARWV